MVTEKDKGAYPVKFADLTVSGRYNDPREMERMLRALGDMYPSIVSFIGAVSCDTQACAVYEITMKAEHEDKAEYVLADLSRSILKLSGGHNGIHAKSLSGGDLGSVGPWWNE